MSYSPTHSGVRFQQVRYQVLEEDIAPIRACDSLCGKGADA